MATTIVTKNGSGAPTASDLVAGELAVDLTNKRLYTEDSGGTVLELGTNPSGDVTFADNGKAIFGAGSDLEILSNGTDGLIRNGNATGEIRLESDDRIIIADRGFNEVFAVFNDDDDVKLYHDGNQKLATTATGIDVTGTIVGDGLTVETSADPALITLRHTGNTSGLIIKNFSGGEAQLVNVDNGPMVFKTNDTERMRIDSAGRVGIGTANPNTSYTLDVSGAIPAVITSTSTATTPMYGGLGVKRETNTNGDGTGIGFLLEDAGDVETEYAYIGGIIESNTAGSEDGGLVIATTLNNVRTQRMRIDSSGNVGIGVVPLDHHYKSLEIGNTGSQITGRTAADTYFMSGVYWSGASTQKYAVSSVPVGSYNITNGVHVWNNAPADTAGNVATMTAAMVLDASGNVKIGDSTTDITSKLVVSGNASADVATFMYDGAAGTYLDIDCGAANGNVTIAADARSGSYPPLLFKTGGTERARLDSSGNLYVGGTDAAYVGTQLITGSYSATSAGLSILSSSSSAGYLLFGDGSGTSGYSGQINYNHATNRMGVNTNNVERLAIDSSGNLSLNSNGSIASLDGVAGMQIGNSGAGSAGLALETSNRGYLMYINGTSLGFWDSSANSERMTIDSSGSINIGVTTPTASTDSLVIYQGDNFALYSGSDGTGGSNHMVFGNANSWVGSITTNGSATQYLTSSDQRLKENIVDAPSASEDIDAIQVRSFDWKADGSHQKYGMVAQELLTVAPSAVAQPENSEDMMGVDYSVLVPMLVKEIQSLRARVAQLES